MPLNLTLHYREFKGCSQVKDRRNHSIGSFYRKVEVQAGVLTYSDELDERILCYSCSTGASQMLSHEVITVSEFVGKTRLMCSIRLNMGVSTVRRLPRPIPFSLIEGVLTKFDVLN